MYRCTSRLWASIQGQVQEGTLPFEQVWRKYCIAPELVALALEVREIKVIAYAAFVYFCRWYEWRLMFVVASIRNVYGLRLHLSRCHQLTSVDFKVYEGRKASCMCNSLDTELYLQHPAYARGKN